MFRMLLTISLLNASFFVQLTQANTSVVKQEKKVQKDNAQKQKDKIKKIQEIDQIQ